MISIDDKLLEEVGLSRLPQGLRKLMFQHIYDTMETRVGATLAGQMTDSQLDDFERIIDAGDESQRLPWLQKNLPQYKDVVASEFEKLKIEIQGCAADILLSEGIEPGSPTIMDVPENA